MQPAGAEVFQTKGPLNDFAVDKLPKRDYQSFMQHEASEQYLLDYLEEEFRGFEDVRIRRILEDHELGVLVRTRSREYFFPMEWAHRQEFKKVQGLAREIRDVLEGAEPSS